MEENGISYDMVIGATLEVVLRIITYKNVILEHILIAVHYNQIGKFLRNLKELGITSTKLGPVPILVFDPGGSK